MNQSPQHDLERVAAQADVDIRALREIVDEIRDESPPAIDWQRVEAKLLPRIENEAAFRRRQGLRQSSWGPLAVFAAAAAAVVVFAAGIAGNTEEPTARRATPVAVSAHELRSDGAHDVQQLKPNTVVESGAEPLRFILPGVATWTLAPNSKVVVDTVTLPHHLTLEQGSLVAEVVPRESSNELVEAFIVEARTTRVAVHGTVFSVERQSDRVTVEVTRGTVTVGPAGYRGATTGRILVSPARADFSLEQGTLIGMRPMRDASPTEPAASAVAERSEPHTPTGPRYPADADAQEPPTTTAAHPTHLPQSSASAETRVESLKPRALSVDEARAMLVGCLSAGTSGSDTTLVTVSSQVTASLDAKGEVMSLQFSPPLRPDLQQRCGGALFGRTIAGQGSVSFGVHFSTR